MYSEKYVLIIHDNYIINLKWTLNDDFYPSSAMPPVNQPPAEPCNPSPCGSNAVCKERNGAGSCTCLSDYTGDPYVGCRPECVQNSDCVHTRACINNKCQDPCVGACGLNAQCQVYNHQPSCSCFSGYTGNPLTSCHLQRGTPTTHLNFRRI